MSVFDDIDKDILDGLRRPAWEVPVEPEGDAAYWRKRAEEAESVIKHFLFYTDDGVPDEYCTPEYRALLIKARAIVAAHDAEKDGE